MVLSAVKTTLGKQLQQTLPTTVCRHPPSEQSVLCLGDRTLHGCEWCGELLDRRPHPLPSDDVPTLEYETLQELRRR
jgi:hypothetical protein